MKQTYNIILKENKDSIGEPSMKQIILLLLLILTITTADDRSIKIKQMMQTEQRIALVIGNNSYQSPLSVLHNPINDARAIKNILENRGFEVIYKKDTTKRELRDTLEKFYQKLKRGGVGMLYFSGHGLEVDGQNYLVPIDANIKAKSDTEFETIALNKITKRMQGINNRLNIVVLDACRNDPFAKAYGVGGLAKAEPIGLFVSYATGAGKVASDGRMGENGLFTKYLIEYMQQPLTLQKVFQKTRASVYNTSGKAQFPAIYDQTINVNFYFTLPSAKHSPNVTNPKEENNAIIPRKKDIITIDGIMYQKYISSATHTWQEAKDYCQGLSLGGYNDWRLSNFKELVELTTLTPDLFKNLSKEREDLPEYLSFQERDNNPLIYEKNEQTRKDFYEKTKQYIQPNGLFLQEQFTDYYKCKENPWCAYWSSDEKKFLGFSDEAYVMNFDVIKKWFSEKTFTERMRTLCVR